MKKVKKEIISKVINLKLNDSFNKDRISFYTGETINGLPFGKGSSETYDTHEMNIKIHKKVGKEWINNYQKNFAVKKVGYNLDSQFVGEWKLGLWNGKGKLTEYYGPEYFINKNGGPKISRIYEGNFVNGKKVGEFKEFMDLGGKGVWKKTFYKNGYLIK